VEESSSSNEDLSAADAQVNSSLLNPFSALTLLIGWHKGHLRFQNVLFESPSIDQVQPGVIFARIGWLSKNWK